MSNSAFITTKEEWKKDKMICVYLHWNGGRDSVEAFLKYCKLKEYRPPETDDYGWARLCQVIGNFFGGSTSVGINYWSKDGIQADNGIYLIENWEIVDRIDAPAFEQKEYKLSEMLIAINDEQPAKEQLPKEVLSNNPVQPGELSVGDVIYRSGFDGSYNEEKVIGIAPCGLVRNGRSVSNRPYTDHYSNGMDNINNYILEPVWRKMPELSFEEVLNG